MDPLRDLFSPPDYVNQDSEQKKISNQDLAAFSYSISHVLRAPLRAIDGFILALLEDYGDRVGDQGQEYISRARAASQYLGDLIDDLLRLTRIFWQEVQRKTVDLTALAVSVAGSLWSDLPEPKIDLHIQSQMEIEGDEKLLRISLSSLFSNAWKFTEPCDQAQIEFGCQEIEGTPTYFARDNGVGFDMDFADKLLQPFQHLHERNDFKGSGIGLAVVQRIILKHGGKIWAESQENQGATFNSILPSDEEIHAH
jgi:light-regulated signal transduction histidine kinase (bacteriophytochrome)